MTEEERANVRVITLQHDALGAGRLEEAASQFSDPTSNHGRVVPRARLLAILTDIRGTFSNLTMPIEDVVASGPKVVIRCRFKGTHDGVGRLPVNGGLMIGVPPTGKTMDVQHIHWYVMKDGLIAEHWANRDDIGMMQQLGLLPETKFDPALFAAPK